MGTDMILKRTSTEEVLLMKKEDILPHPRPLHPLVIKKIIREENLLMRRNPNIVRKETNRKRKVKEDFRKSSFTFLFLLVSFLTIFGFLLISRFSSLIIFFITRG